MAKSCIISTAILGHAQQMHHNKAKGKHWAKKLLFRQLSLFCWLDYWTIRRFLSPAITALTIAPDASYPNKDHAHLRRVLRRISAGSSAQKPSLRRAFMKRRKSMRLSWRKCPQPLTFHTLYNETALHCLNISKFARSPIA